MKKYFGLASQPGFALFAMMKLLLKETLSLVSQHRDAQHEEKLFWCRCVGFF